MAVDLTFLDDDNLGIAVTDATQPSSVYDKFILKVSNQLATEFRDYTKKVANNTGGLAASIIPVPKGALSFELQADSYYPFVDEGVNSVNSNNYNSRFSFRYPGVSHNMATAIQGWKGLDINEAYAVAAGIKQKGLSPKNITQNVITEDTLNKIAEDLLSITGLMFDVRFKLDK